jgi:hypothetical protein
MEVARVIATDRGVQLLSDRCSHISILGRADPLLSS